MIGFHSHGAPEFSQIWAGKLGLYPLSLHKPFINFNLNKQKCIFGKL